MVDMVHDSGLGRPKIVRLEGPHQYGGYNEVRTWVNGTTCYLLDGQFHRLDGPAFVDAEGNRTWHRHGREHRVDGPAVEFTDGLVEFWVNGRQVDEHQFRGITRVHRPGWRRLFDWKRQ